MELVELRGGLVVRRDAFELAHRLEGRGHRMAVSDGVLNVSNGSQLGADDRKAIKALRAHLIALVEYRCPR